MQRPTTVAIGGFTSDVGKTTLMCDLLRALPGWEAIKTTRGHYRSCGKDPHTCCVSHLLSDEPVILSGHEQTYSTGKDTGHYWDAGAANVHWLIATTEQVERGIRLAIKRVSAPGVLIEGNSFTEFVSVDFMLMVARSEGEKIKPSARRVLLRANPLWAALYLSEPRSSSSLTNSDRQDGTGIAAREQFSAWRDRAHLNELQSDLPIFTQADLPCVVAELQRMHAGVNAVAAQAD